MVLHAQVCGRVGRCPIKTSPGESRGFFLFDPFQQSNYNVIMKASLIQIGNSRGVRIPKAFLKEAGLHDQIEIEVRGSQIVLRASKRPREGWREAFRKMAAYGDDALIDTDAPALSSWDEREWEW
jgi:antitoxin MazE